jgi:hypothetical protein
MDPRQRIELEDWNGPNTLIKKCGKENALVQYDSYSCWTHHIADFLRGLVIACAGGVMSPAVSTAATLAMPRACPKE